MTTELFDTLRHLLHDKAPSTALFNKVSAQIDPEQELLAHISDYLQEHIGQWPTTIDRPMPKAWILSLAKGNVFTPAKLCTSLAPPYDMELQPDDIKRLVGSPCLSDLRILDVNPNQAPNMTFGDDAAAIIAASTHLSKVYTLNMRRCELTEVGFTALLTSTHLHSLQHLDASKSSGNTPKIDPQPEVSVRIPLQSLDLSNHVIKPEGAIALTSSSGLSELRTLKISLGFIGDDGAKAIASCAQFSKLTELGLHYNKITAEGVVALLNSPHLKELKSLDLSHNDITDDMLVAIAAAPGLSRLTWLDLGDNDISDRGAQALAESEHASNLKILSLAYNGLTENGGRELLVSPHLNNVERLSLIGNTFISDGDIPWLYNLNSALSM